MVGSPQFDPHHSALFTDLYQLTMLQAYYAEGMTEDATFELYFRKLPKRRNFVMAAGLEQVLDFLEELHFSETDLEWLDGLGQFSKDFLDTLRAFRFSGEAWAVPEGTVVFENEPVVQITAPLPEAQLVETFVLNQIHLQSLAATKATRLLSAAQDRRVVDFGSRRSHGTDAALKVARTSYLAGAAGTSNVAAGRLYAIPVFGTLAHSYIEAHGDEKAAFAAFAREFPETTLLVDTYDTLNGVRKVIDLARDWGAAFKVKQIRLDSGDLARLARDARALLDEAGLERVRIIASSGLDEYKIAQLLAAGAPIDGFGVGTELAVSGDAPEIDFSYKLVAYAGQPRMKLSASKVNMPGRKQVHRTVADGRFQGDTISCFDEPAPGEGLLEPVMREGRRLGAGRASLEQARDHARRQLAALPPALLALEQSDTPYPVAVSPALRGLTRTLGHELAETMRYRGR